MFVSRRACPGCAGWLLGSALTAALLTNIRTQLVTQEPISHALATCFSLGKASLVASRSLQYFTSVNLTRSSTVMCQLNVSMVTGDDPLAVYLNRTFLANPKLRLLFKIDRLHLEERTSDAPECTNTSYVALRRMADRSHSLCKTSADMYAWSEDWLTVIIFPHSERSILRFEASFAALLAINVCEGGQKGAAAFEVDNITYVYAPDAWYEALLRQESKCKADLKYTVLARAANASRQLRVTVLTAPATGDGGCQRLCVDSRCFVAGDANAFFDSTGDVSIVYAAVRRCTGVEQTGFTLKLESVLLQQLRSRSSDGVIALVSSLIAVALAVVIFVVTVIAFRRSRLRGGERGYPLSEPSSEAMVSRQSNEYTSVPLSCPDGSDVAAASVVSAEKDIAMVENDLYT